VLRVPHGGPESGFDQVFLLLQGPHLGIHAIAFEQRAVRAALDDASGVEHQDLVGVHHRRQPVRDDQRGAADGDLFEFGLDRLFGLRVERRGGLVEDQDRRVLQQARAMATRCFSPPESFRPRSPTRVS
jgi:hypothetical protein